MSQEYIEKNWKIWNEQNLTDPDLTAELQEMKNDEKKIEDCFYRDLEFGTGGLRGVIGVGTNRMNVYTVAKATQGYSNYLNQHLENPSVAIAHDSRIKSDKFAEVAAEVFAANGIPILILCSPSFKLLWRYCNNSKPQPIQIQWI